MGSVAAGGDDEVRLFLTRPVRQLDQVLRALTFANLKIDGVAAEDLQRAVQQVPRPAMPRGRVQQNGDSHESASEGCRIGGRKSRWSILRRELMRLF
jgi:hypothetical protein